MADATDLKLRVLRFPRFSNLAAASPDKVVAMKQRIDELAKSATKPLFFEAQFKVVMKNMNGEPVMPTDEGFGSDDDNDPTPPKIGNAH